MLTRSHYLLPDFWTLWRRIFVWIICIGALTSLGLVQHATDAEFALTALIFFPVIVITWINGQRGGLIFAFIAAATFAVGDITSEKQFSSEWIPVANTATRLITYGLLALLITQLRQQYIRQRELASRDSLTSLWNRRAFLEIGHNEVDRSIRYLRPLSIVFLDLDSFKQLNDTQGHEAGDEALQATAKAILGTLRSSDQVARLGGDEFAILLPEVGYEEAGKAGRKIFLALERALEKFPPVTTSMGIAWFETVDRPFPEMLKAADELMYTAKSDGKNGICIKQYYTKVAHP